LSKEGQPERGQTNAYSSEQGGTNKESADSAPRLSHEQLVKGFRDYIQQEQQKCAEFHDMGILTPHSPEAIIRSRLVFEWQTGRTSKEKEVRAKREFAYHLELAWNVLAYYRYDPGSVDERDAGSKLQLYYYRTREQVIKLTEPQISIIDALAEAVGIPHERGQAEIVIPEKLKYYSKYQLTKEYQERLPKSAR
jgi:hypothetical protein